MPAGTKPAASGGGGIKSKYMHSVAILGSSLSHGLHTCFLPPLLPQVPWWRALRTVVSPAHPQPCVGDHYARNTHPEQRQSRREGGDGERVFGPRRPLGPPRPPLRNAATTIQATSILPKRKGWGLTQNSPVRGPAPCVGHCANMDKNMRWWILRLKGFVSFLFQ